jgi:phage terminase large subunit-like protein
MNSMPTSLIALQDGLRAGLKFEALWPTLPQDVREYLRKNWPQFAARPHQLPPDGDWLTWMILGGRGSGKTRAGAEWVRRIATATPPLEGPIALVGETFADAREVMIEGVAGLLTIHGSWERPRWLPSRRLLVWKNGAIAQAFSAEDPEALRGPQFAAAWADAALPAPIGEWSGWIISAIFLSESGERITRTLMRKR